MLCAMKLGRYRGSVMSNATTKLLVPCIEASGVRHGLNVKVVGGEYGQVMQQALAADSPVRRANPDAVLLALDFRGIPGLSEIIDDDDAVDRAMSFMRTVLDGVRGERNIPVIVQTVPDPPQPLFGNHDPAIKASQRRRIRDFNRVLADGWLREIGRAHV
mgnify:CR=1 FL=1